MAAISSLFQVKLLHRRIPLYCEWEVTNRCNMKCGFCSTWTESRNSSVDTTTDEAMEIIGQLAEMGTRLMHFSGGEPTLRGDLPLLIERAKEKGMIVSFTTNGSASRDTMKKLLPADIICVSLDEIGECHDTLRGMPGGYLRAIETMQFLVAERKTPIMTCTYFDETSYETLRRLAELARSMRVHMKLTVIGKRLNIKPGGELRFEHHDQPAIFAKYVSALSRLQEEFSDTLANPEPFLSIIAQGGLDVYGCRAMDISISIKADGSVSMPCTGIQDSLRKGRLRDIYYSSEAIKIRERQGRFMECSHCTIRCMASASALLRMSGCISIFNSYIGSLRLHSADQGRCNRR